MMTSKVFVFVIALAMPLSVHAEGEEDVVMDSLEEAAKIVYTSRELVESNYPESVHVLDWAMVVIDRGGYWEVTFIPKKMILGGAPVFHLEKGSLKLIESFHTQ